MSEWYVFDPEPPDGAWPSLFGPFKSEEEALDYANVMHPDDTSGNTIVLTLTPP